MRSRSIPLALLLCLAAVYPVAGQTGVLVVAHGADSAWNSAVRGTVAEVRWTHGPVATAFLMGPEARSAGWDAALARLVAAGVQHIVVVPLMVSSHGSHYRQVQHYAGLLPDLPTTLAGHDHRAMPAPPTVPVVVTPALDVASELGTVLAVRWAALDSADRGRAVVLVAHGPESDEEATRWVSALGTVGMLLHGAGLERDFRVGLLRDDAAAPVRAAAIRELRDTVLALAARTGDSVVAIPVMIASSSITRQRIPADLAGLPVRYASTPLTPHPAISRWIERVAEEAVAQLVAR